MQRPQQQKPPWSVLAQGREEGSCGSGNTQTRHTGAHGAHTAGRQHQLLPRTCLSVHSCRPRGHSRAPTHAPAEACGKGTPTPTHAHSGHADERTAHGVTYLRHTDTSTCRKGQRGTATSHVQGTHAHTTDVHARRHSVHSKDKDMVSPHPHITTHKHANRSTHTGGCCVAPTSTCGVFAFCLFWERETNRFSAPQPPEQPQARSRLPTCRERCGGPPRPHGLHGPLASADAQPSTLQGRGVTPCRVQTRGSASYSGQAEARRVHVPRHWVRRFGCSTLTPTGTHTST